MSLSPMMRQYLELKEKYKDTLLFFRLGDFYEMFFEDAILASKELDIALTGRDCGLDKRAPMCGVPYHSANSYISKLINKGYKVAICEQLTEPKGRGIVDREVVRIITPGTVTEDNILEREKNNYLMSVYADEENIGVAWADISTGELGFCTCESMINLNELLSKLEPSEIICNMHMQLKSIDLSAVKYGVVCPFSIFDETAFDFNNAQKTIAEQLGNNFLQSMTDKISCISATGALLEYITYTQKRTLNHLKPKLLDDSKYMSMDSNARRNLELFQNLHDGKKKGSLLWVLDRTKTAMGARALRSILENPLLDETELNNRLDAVEELVKDQNFNMQKLNDLLLNVKDIERIAGRLACGNISPKECLSLGYSLKTILEIKPIIDQFKSTIFKQISKNISDHKKVSSLILSAINPEPPNYLKDGGVFNQGFDELLDKYLDLKNNSKKHLAKLEMLEKNETGIKNLKIGYNKIIGYYIEVTKSNLDQVPYRYERKASTINSERFITQELKEIERDILNAEDNALQREIELYQNLLDVLKSELDNIFNTAKSIAYLDCMLSFAQVSKENNYVRPLISRNSNQIKIIEGRHPVVEKLINEPFTPNDTLLDNEENKIILITGPNMAGKSVYMRQVALIVIMAQIGCFVPANQAEIGIVDKIFTRIGASDDIKTGRSTFMMEMSEVSEMLKSAGDKSLILLDEVGRGTATYDGLSIAWALIEFLAEKFKSKVLFSTHYHELTKLEEVICGIKNYKLSVREVNNNIIFVRKLMRGSANKSFGIEVAALAGLPNELILRAKELLIKLEKIDISKQTKINTGTQTSMFSSESEREIIKILSELDIDSISPRYALDILSDLKEKATK